MTIYRRRTSYVVAATGPTPLVWYQFNEGSGTTTANSGSGANLNGTLVGANAAWITGYSGFGINVFRTTSGSAPWDGVTSATNASLNTINNLTIMVRVRSTSFIAGFGDYIHFGVFTSDLNRQVATLFLSATTVAVSIFPASASAPVDNMIQTPAKTPISNWTHYAFSYDGTTTRLYTNGSLSGSSTTASGNLKQVGDRRIVTGGSYGPQSTQLDDFRLYDSVLTQAEIAAIASA